MKLQFLGTGAANWPDPGAHVGEGRRETSMVVNDWLMIDCGTMTVEAIEEFGVDVNRLTDVIISHLHNDHCSRKQLTEIAGRRNPELPPLNVWMNQAGLDSYGDRFRSTDRLQYHGFQVDGTFACGKTTIRTFEANHEMTPPNVLPAHFFITFDNGETLFYGLDGSWFVPKTWQAMQKLKIDAMIWELTCGNLADWRLWGHCNFGMLKLMAAAFRNDGTLHPGTAMFCSHLAQGLCPPHDLYSRELATDGFILAKDGMCWQSGRE